MKTPWSTLVQYGTAVAAVVVICIAGVIFLAVVGVAVALTKLLMFIK